MAATRATSKTLVRGQNQDAIASIFSDHHRHHHQNLHNHHHRPLDAFEHHQHQDGPHSSSPELAGASSKLKSNLVNSSSSSVSPSSLQSLTTDSDSFQGLESVVRGPIGVHEAFNERQSSPSANQLNYHQDQSSQSSKSPILIKYNYYDYNGERQENRDIQSGGQRVQRQLSPTFKQSLDQIVRSSQQHLAGQQRQQSTSPISPRHSPNGGAFTMTLLARRYKLSSYEHRCLRCTKTVYQMDKVGPLKDFTFYHQNCFKCRECGTKLTLKTYFNNQHSSTDQEVYCHRHCPKTPAGKLDNQSVGIRAALNAPKVFDPIHQEQFPHQLHQNPQQQLQQPQVDARAMHIRHAVKQTKLQAIYKSSQVDKKISQFLNRRLEYLEPKQKMLEMRHREEEEQLFKVFEEKWLQEESSIRNQIREEWQRELNKLLDKYKRQLSTNFTSTQTQTNPNPRNILINNNNNNNNVEIHHKQVAPTKSIAPHDQPHQTSQARLDFHRLPAVAPVQPEAAGQLSSGNSSEMQQRMIELERLNLEKTMTIKLDRKKETLKRKLKEFERQATAELVEKQSREMITLISLKLEEFKEEQKRKIGSDLEQFEAIESLANHLGASLQISSQNSNGKQIESLRNGQEMNNDATKRPVASRQDLSTSSNQTMGAPPLPKAPQLSKMELYNSDQPDELFKEIDQLAINVAKEDQRTFTDLVHHLTRHCLTDVEKVRAIFRWITVKNLNTMEFDSSIKADTPLGLLRGIKQGSESYHVLFKRLCSYAGLHCVVIKGYSKSAGYQPGFRFEGNRFRNSWNAVYVAGAWRFVQCNWGARHLVSVAVMQDKSSNSNQNGKIQNKGRSAARLSSVSVDLTNNQNQLAGANLGRRGQLPLPNGVVASRNGLVSPACSSSDSSCSYSSPSPPHSSQSTNNQIATNPNPNPNPNHRHRSGSGVPLAPPSDSLRYEYDDHYFLTDPDEFIYEFFPLAPEWQLLKTRPISLHEFEQLPFVRSLFFKYGLYFPQADISSVLYTNSSGATTIKIGMPTHMIPSLIFHYNLKYFDSDCEQHDGISLKRFVMQSVESAGNDQQTNASATPTTADNLLSNIVSFRVHVPENGAYILDIFANSTTPNQYVTGEPMKFKSVCKFKIIARNLKTVMVPLPDCASGEYGPMKATRLFGIIPLTHENGLISVQSEKRFLEIQFRMTRPLLDFMASLHKNGQDERQLSKLIKIFIDGDIVFIAIKFHEDGQYGLDIYTRDHQTQLQTTTRPNVDQKHHQPALEQPKKQLLTHCCKYLINVRAAAGGAIG